MKLARVAFLLLGLFWGSNFIYMKYASQFISPMQIAFVRVLFGFLPSYAAFVTAGVLSYAFCLHRLRAWLGARSLDPAWVAMELGIHLVSAVGVLIGRVARLNSWDAVVRPRTTVWHSLATLSRPSSVLVVVAFAAVLFVGCRLLSLLLHLARSVIWNVTHP